MHTFNQVCIHTCNKRRFARVLLQVNGLDGNASVVDLSNSDKNDTDLIWIVERLARMPNLVVLDLSENQIVDVAPLATLVNLTALNLNGNQIVES